ncbi:hypothetical protein LNTAR_08759 [Lentisphaera araneosa HTCC2155]|uniref:Uncharacterized protein n=1 Tax=Lentisphaera araneosa HTCC2155 TaxID=313628 RepID=A6DHZ3_9BACT|nr:hypothetical protein LNTAR_08759 [Lentisphaera araneosa HTCC2155]
MKIPGLYKADSSKGLGDICYLMLFDIDISCWKTPLQACKVWVFFNILTKFYLSFGFAFSGCLNNAINIIV